MISVFVVHHVRPEDQYGDHAKLIGVYSLRETATAAIERLSAQPGFRDHPAGFSVIEYPLDKDHWTEGFGIADD